VGINGWPVADSDMHVMEPADLWERYIAPQWRHVAPVGLAELHRDMRVRVKGTVLTRVALAKPNFDVTVGWKPNQDSAFARSEARNWDAKSQLMAMDDEGLDVAVLFSSRGLFVLGLDHADIAGPEGLEPELAAAIARAYNDWLHDFCAEDTTRLLGAGLLAPHDVALAVEEIGRCVDELGFKTVFMHPAS
jgi:predicted TIM-barrel fold metal-dependent hydrolase